jgi:hypothetical protein
MGYPSLLSSPIKRVAGAWVDFSKKGSIEILDIDLKDEPNRQKGSILKSTLMIFL